MRPLAFRASTGLPGSDGRQCTDWHARARWGRQHECCSLCTTKHTKTGVLRAMRALSAAHRSGARKKPVGHHQEGSGEARKHSCEDRLRLAAALLEAPESVCPRRFPGPLATHFLISTAPVLSRATSPSRPRLGRGCALSPVRICRRSMTPLIHSGEYPEEISSNEKAYRFRQWYHLQGLGEQAIARRVRPQDGGVNEAVEIPEGATCGLESNWSMHRHSHACSRSGSTQAHLKARARPGNWRARVDHATVLWHALLLQFRRPLNHRPHFLPRPLVIFGDLAWRRRFRALSNVDPLVYRATRQVAAASTLDMMPVMALMPSNITFPPYTRPKSPPSEPDDLTTGPFQAISLRFSRTYTIL